MSNALAIAATTATLEHILTHSENELDVTVNPLDVAGKANSDHVNLFLYQTSIDAAWRNQAVPSKVNKGETGQPALPLCLYYLITAYAQGDKETKAQQLLGAAMNILHDHPLLGKDEIKAATETNVKGSNLHEQVEHIRITPHPLSLEEMSKLWTIFQTQYRISAAYEVSVVLIESTRPTRTPLPVLKRGKDDQGPTVQADLIPPFPALERIILPNGHGNLQLNDQITLTGHHFALGTGDPTQVTLTVEFITTRLTEPIFVLIPPNDRTDKQIQVKVPHQGSVFYPAGLYRVLVNVHLNGQPSQEHKTNEFPLMIAPTIKKINGTDLPLPSDAPISVARTNVEDEFGDATLQITCEPEVLLEQTAALLIGDRLVAAEARTNKTDLLSFVAKRIAAETYRLRLRVDGVDSPLIDFSDPAEPRFDDTQRVTIT